MEGNKFFRMVLVLSLIGFVIGCTNKELVTDEQGKSLAQLGDDEIKLTPSTAPPTNDEIINLENGYQITSAMKLVIDKRCQSNDLKGGDTGAGYGCIA